MFKKTITALALIGAFASAQAAAQIGPNYAEGFDLQPGKSAQQVLTGKGWLIYDSTPLGLTHAWGQGSSADYGIDGQAGGANSFLTSDYNNTVAGGSLSSWLLSPVFTASYSFDVSFWLRGILADGYSDSVTFGFVNAAGDLNSFVAADTVVAGGDWTKYTVSFLAKDIPAGVRFAIGYIGSADSSNAVAIDSFASVPEPSSWALAGVSLLGLLAARRRRA
ncbi:choice-of-anchor J family PEP-CTERM protein [Roseateles chitosanitabidus]|uniref:choice-of-anchor J family PEP-CTERM protein n=1 Tax=Roseateles chitosanitabidus TaxID=65048 RepID=UPI000836DE2E|nr:choice-of-anchor J domain-containing protein [Roseateles chitosanitabidus]MBO9687883.1 choice-of-anchor J domain-containing protein [Roseateles chitosanitabidus]